MGFIDPSELDTPGGASSGSFISATELDPPIHPLADSNVATVASGVLRGVAGALDTPETLVRLAGNYLPGGPATGSAALIKRFGLDDPAVVRSLTDEQRSQIGLILSEADKPVIDLGGHLGRAVESVSGVPDPLHINPDSYLGKASEMVPYVIGGGTGLAQRAAKDGVVKALATKAAETIGQSALLGGGAYGGKAVGGEIGSLFGEEYRPAGEVVGELSGMLTASALPRLAKSVIGGEVNKLEQGLVGYDPASRPRLARGPEADAIREATGKQVSKKDLLFRDIQGSDYFSRIKATDTPATASAKLQDFANETGKKIPKLIGELSSEEKALQRIGATGETTFNTSDITDYIKNEVYPVNETLARSLLKKTQKLQTEWNGGGKSIGELNALRQKWGKLFSNSFNRASDPKGIVQTFPGLVYGTFKDQIATRTEEIAKLAGRPELARDFLKVNKEYSAAKTFEPLAFAAQTKGGISKVGKDFSAYKFIRPLAYAGLGYAGGPVGAAIAIGDLGRVLAHDIAPVQTRAALKQAEKVANALDIYSGFGAKAAAPAAVSERAQAKMLDAPKNLMLDYVPLMPEKGGQGIYPRYNPERNVNGSLATVDPSNIFNIRPNPQDLGLKVIPEAQPAIVPGTSYDLFERGIVNPNAKIIKPNSKELSVDEQDLVRRLSQGKVGLPPEKQLSLAKQSATEADGKVANEAQSSITKLKNSIDPIEFEGDLVSDSSFKIIQYQEGSEQYTHSRNAEGSTTNRGAMGTADYTLGAKAVSDRAKLLEFLPSERKDGRVFSDAQLSALQKADDGDGLAFIVKNKTYKPDGKATEDFLAAFNRKQLSKEQFERLSVGLKSPMRLNGVDVSPHKTLDVPEDWINFIKDAPMPKESGSITKGALSALTAAGLAGTYYIGNKENPKMEDIKPKDLITADDLYEAQVYQESRGDSRAVSPKNAKGTMQLMDDTGRELFEKYKDTLKELGIKADKYAPFDEKQNIFLGKAYMKELLDQFGDPALALTAYHSGPDRVARLLKISGGETLDDILKIPFAKGGLGPAGRTYATQILDRYKRMKG